MACKEGEGEGEACPCDPPCGAQCVLPECDSPATVVVSGDRVFADDEVMITDLGVATDPVGWDVWVCKPCSVIVGDKKWVAI